MAQVASLLSLTQGPVGPPGFPGIPGDPGLKGEKVLYSVMSWHCCIEKLLSCGLVPDLFVLYNQLLWLFGMTLNIGVGKTTQTDLGPGYAYTTLVTKHVF